MKITYRDITNQPKKNSINIPDEEVDNVISRMIYAFQVYQTKGHDLDKCDCHGCRYARNIRYYLGNGVCKKLKRNW